MSLDDEDPDEDSEEEDKDKKKEAPAIIRAVQCEKWQGCLGGERSGRYGDATHTGLSTRINTMSC